MTLLRLALKLHVPRTPNPQSLTLRLPRKGVGMYVGTGMLFITSILWRAYKYRTQNGDTYIQYIDTIRVFYVAVAR